MLKKVLTCVSLAALGAGLLVPGYAAAPAKIAKVAPVADLVAEAEAKIAALEASLASNDSYLKDKKTTIPVEASVLAILAQAIAEDEEKAGWKASAPDLRDAAMAVANSKSYDEAKKGLAGIKDAHGGKAAGAKPAQDWNKLAKLSNVMVEVNKRTGKLRKALRKSPEEENARDASVLAVLALVAHEDTHEVKKKDEIPKWQGYAVTMQTEMTALAAAIKAKDATASKTAWTKAQKSCTECHEVFREN